MIMAWLILCALITIGTVGWLLLGPWGALAALSAVALGSMIITAGVTI